MIYAAPPTGCSARDPARCAKSAISGTQRGQRGPLPSTGKRVQFEEIVILQIRDGKVRGQRGIVDNLNALRQLGVVPTPRS